MLEPESPFETPWERHHLRVPQENGGIFCRPPWSDAVAAVERGRALLDTERVNIQGRTLSHLREWTARKVFEAAVDYTAKISGEPIETPDVQTHRFVASGHQPTLFHPGVWIKNFAIGELAAATGRVPLNLIVDNDTFADRSLRVPAGTADEPATEVVPFDAHTATLPWEEARVRDETLFRSFADRVTERMQRWGVTPLLQQIWPDAVERYEAGRPLTECLTAARHRLERRWGLRNLELPLSRLSELDPFLWFAGHLFAHAERFRDVHNRALQQFRRINRVRSRTHPFPELIERDGWIETPFWIWTDRSVRRRRAFVRQLGKETELSDGAGVTVRFPLSREMDACCAVEELRELPRRGIRLRTRAVSTTLFSRLCLADLFVHGIGGAKYDEMTDRIIARLFGLPAPPFVTTSATIHLPLGTPFDISPADRAELQQRLRDLQYNPQRYLSDVDDPETARLIAEKRALIEEQQATQPTRRGPRKQTRRQRREKSLQNRRRYRRLQEINRRLEELTTEQQRCVERRIAETQRRLAANSLLANRELSFCLYPEEALRPIFTRLSHAGVAEA